jgi:hypothetical protein
MHQQVRTSPSKRDAPGAMAANDGSFLDILGILGDAGLNLQSVGGSELDGEGEFVFSVHHEDDDPDRPTDEAVALLERNGYRPYVVRPHVCEVSDDAGSLVSCIKESVGREDIAELHVGTGTPVPVQVVTRQRLDEGRRGGKSSAT